VKSEVLNEVKLCAFAPWWYNFLSNNCQKLKVLKKERRKSSLHLLPELRPQTVPDKILDTKDNYLVYLGFQDDIISSEFRKVLEESIKKTVDITTENKSHVMSLVELLYFMDFIKF
jgi:hypothetical protein